MKRLWFVLSAIVLLVAGSASGQLNSRECSNPLAARVVLAMGPPVLSQQTTDCALDFIAFSAAVVKGVDGMEIDPVTRANWAVYLAAGYPSMPPVLRYWFASAPDSMKALRTDWPRLSLVQRLKLQQQWAAQMPAILEFIAPVVFASPQGTARSINQQLGEMIQQAQWAQMQQAQQPAVADPQLQELHGFYNDQARAITVQHGMQIQAADTINLMHAMSGSH